MLREFGAPDDVTGDVELALAEACSNAVRHAAGSRGFEVTIHLDEHGCSMEVGDFGPGFSPEEVEIAGVHDEQGRGLGLIAALVDDLSCARRGNGMRVHLWKRWSLEDVDGQGGDGSLSSRESARQLS